MRSHPLSEPVATPSRVALRRVLASLVLGTCLIGGAAAQGVPPEGAALPPGGLDEVGTPAPGSLPVAGPVASPPVAPAAPLVAPPAAPAAAAPPARAASLGLSLGVSRSFPALDVRPRLASGGFPRGDLVRIADIEASVPDPAEAMARFRGALGGALTLHRAAVLTLAGARPGDGPSPVIEAVSVVLGGLEVPRLHALATGPGVPGDPRKSSSLGALFDDSAEMTDLRLGLAEGLAAVVSNPRPGPFAEGLFSVSVAQRQEHWMDDLEDRLAVLRGRTTFPAGETPPALDRSFARAYLASAAVAEVAYRAAALHVSAQNGKTGWRAPTGPEGRAQVRDAVRATYHRLASGRTSTVVPDALGVEPSLPEATSTMLSALFILLVLAGTLGVLLDPPESAWVDLPGEPAATA